MRMTVAQLAKQVGVSRNTVTNWEGGKTEPSASELVRIAAALGCRITDLLVAEVAAAPPRFAFRAHSPLRNDPSITVMAGKFLRAYDEIEEITGTRLCSQLRRFECDSEGPPTDREIESAADTLRETCGIHDRGPENIASVLEGLGVRCLFFEHEGKGLDGISTIQNDMTLMLLRDRQCNIERTIYSAAHELGHLVLHEYLFTEEPGEEDGGRDYEREANKFAGFFLVPSDELVRIWKEERLHRLSLFYALLSLKRVFHVSFSCLFFRVTDLGLVPTTDWAVFTNQIKSQLGITGKARKEDLEPEPLPSGALYRSTRFRRLVRSAFLQDLIGVGKVAELLQVTVDRAKEITTDWLRPKDVLVDECPL
jgi:Zn-dependent peptidase ImmA (M78 family)/transcriptional regulator with XRE-family HTH domain